MLTAFGMALQIVGNLPVPAFRYEFIAPAGRKAHGAAGDRTAEGIVFGSVRYTHGSVLCHEHGFRAMDHADTAAAVLKVKWPFHVGQSSRLEECECNAIRNPMTSAFGALQTPATNTPL